MKILNALLNLHGDEAPQEAWASYRQALFEALDSSLDGGAANTPDFVSGQG